MTTATSLTGRAGLLGAAGVGLVAGFLSGLFGVGGGILIVPGLMFLLAMERRPAHGTSLAAVLPIALSGVVGFAMEGKVDWPVAVALTVGAMAGAVLGTYALHIVPTRVLGYGFAVLLVLSAVRLVVGESEASGRGELDVAMVVGAVLLGVVAGTLAGMLGVGGGIVMVPSMIIVFGITAAVAKGTSLAVMIPTSLVATARNVRKGNADLRTAAAVGLAGVVSAFVSSKISVGLDEDVSNALFAALLAVVAVRMVVSTAREDAARRRADADPIGSTDLTG